VALLGLDLVGGQDFVASEVDDGDLGVVGEREHALSGVGAADAEVMHPPVRAPSRSTISRILSHAGLVCPEPRKRPKSSYLRFEAAQPNECWQSDLTHRRTLDRPRAC
jgi:hypothetical protein